eukprot:2961895-Pyramimonas_sp.AAC.1
MLGQRCRATELSRWQACREHDASAGTRAGNEQHQQFKPPPSTPLLGCSVGARSCPRRDAESLRKLAGHDARDEQEHVPRHPGPPRFFK